MNIEGFILTFFVVGSGVGGHVINDTIPTVEYLCYHLDNVISAISSRGSWSYGALSYLASFWGSWNHQYLNYSTF